MVAETTIRVLDLRNDETTPACRRAGLCQTHEDLILNYQDYAEYNGVNLGDDFDEIVLRMQPGQPVQVACRWAERLARKYNVRVRFDLMNRPIVVHPSASDAAVAAWEKGPTIGPIDRPWSTTERDNQWATFGQRVDEFCTTDAKRTSTPSRPKLIDGWKWCDIRANVALEGEGVWPRRAYISGGGIRYVDDRGHTVTDRFLPLEIVRALLELHDAD